MEMKQRLLPLFLASEHARHGGYIGIPAAKQLYSIRYIKMWKEFWSATTGILAECVSS